MKNIRFILYLSPLWVAMIILFSGWVNSETGSIEERIYRDYNGVIAIEAENYSQNQGWFERQYYTGIGISIDLKAQDRTDAFVGYDLDISIPGIYYLFVLGNRERNTSIEENIIEFSVIDESGNQVSTVKSGFNPLNAPAWASVNFSEPGEKCHLNFPNKGRYKLMVRSDRGDRFFIDKVVLSSHDGYLPEGTGPEETCTREGKADLRGEIILPPQWVFGVLYGGYTDHHQSIEVLDSLILGDFPVDAYWIDSYFWDFNKGKGPKGYIDFRGDTTAFPDQLQLWKALQDRKIKAGLWIWNLILEEGNETVYEDFLQRGYFSNTFKYTNGWHNATHNTMAGEIDFDNPMAMAYWKQKMKPFFDQGLDFLKLDNSSAISFCHAAYTATQELGLETKGRGFILAHIHTVYDYRHKLYPTRWTGDAKISWTQPDYPNMNVYAMGALKENIAMVSDPKRSTYEVPFLSHDAGGYDYFGSQEQDEELYMRWIQFASMNSIMMFFSTSKNPTRNHPYRYSEMVQDNFRKYTHLRMRLFPYIYSYALKTYLTGTKMIKGDHDYNYQYLFGHEILVAPVYEKGATKRIINLPAGDWVDPETNIVYKGGKQILFEAPVTKLPLLVRKGAIIPMRHYARAIELGNNDTLIIEAYPSDQLTSFELLEDDGLSNDYLEGRYATTSFTLQQKNKGIDFSIAPVSGDYDGMQLSRYYVVRMKLCKLPQSIALNGNDSGMEWSYSNEQQTVEMRFQGSKSIVQKIRIKF